MCIRDRKMAIEGTAETSATNNFRPVSYTHLDVYKRQYLRWVAVGIRRLRGRCRSAGCVPCRHRRRRPQWCPRCPTAGTDGTACTVGRRTGRWYSVWSLQSRCRFRLRAGVWSPCMPCTSPRHPPDTPSSPPTAGSASAHNITNKILITITQF